ncbi:SGNH/GDSL hydrolase family protein [Coraliomargarita parva]|uniref:SGNH/GDSL hydrolase family protein n=1 Tax=Coraliomargarita parva TaxID=3014050 RepID=UPI0022B599AD|nr:SGNH/GDSL hydrolase family protein [Coraliomargarita parva]
MHPISRFCVLLLVNLCTLYSLPAAEWTRSFQDDFERTNSTSAGNEWEDNEGIASIENGELVLTNLSGDSGFDMRVSRPGSEASLSQRIDASFVLTDNGSDHHCAYVRGQSLVLNGEELYPVMLASVRHSGSLSLTLRYQGGAVSYLYTPQDTSFTPVIGHTYTLSVMAVNNYPTLFEATLTDEDTGTQEAYVSYSNYGFYTSSKNNMSPDFFNEGVCGVSMQGGANDTARYTEISTYEWTATGDLDAAISPAVAQHDGKTYLASPTPDSGTPPYTVRWYRGGNGFTPPLTIDGSGSGSGEFIGEGMTVTDENPPESVSNYSISYRAVYFDSGDHASTGLAGNIINRNSPSSKTIAAPLWIGDSITYGYATSRNTSTSPPSYAETFLKNDTDLSQSHSFLMTGSNANLGLSGRTSTDMLGQIKLIMGRARLYGATFSSIMLGTNDSKDSVATSPETYKANIQTIMDGLWAVNPDMQIILNKPLWFLPDSGYSSDFSTASLARIDEYRSQLDKLADGTRVVVGDLTASDEIESFGWTGTSGVNNAANATTSYPPQPDPGASYLIDGLHPYDGGAQMIAQLEWGPNVKQALQGTFTPFPESQYTYGMWVEDRGLSGEDAAENADYNHNGVVNMVEYALTPYSDTFSQDILPQMDVGEDGISLRYQALRDSIVYQPMWSDGLSSWSDQGFQLSYENEETIASIGWGPDGHRFLKLVLLPN